MKKWEKIAILIIFLGFLVWFSLILNSIISESNKNYEERIKSLEYKITVLENSINRKDTIVINFNQKVK